MAKRKKQQVILVHGGEVFKTQSGYIRWLKTRPITKQSFLPRSGWKKNLAKDLGNRFEVLQPQMPNASNASYREWKINFQRLLPFVSSEAVLIGHSLGGIFLTKLLSETKWPKRIRALILIAAPYKQSGYIGDFRLSSKSPILRQNIRRVILFYSLDDRVVPYREHKAYLTIWPGAELKTYRRAGHFNQTRLPQLVKQIQGLI